MGMKDQLSIPAIGKCPLFFPTFRGFLMTIFYYVLAFQIKVSTVARYRLLGVFAIWRFFLYDVPSSYLNIMLSICGPLRNQETFFIKLKRNKNV